MEIDDLIVKRFKIIEKDSLPFKSSGGTREMLAKVMGEKEETT